MATSNLQTAQAALEQLSPLITTLETERKNLEAADQAKSDFIAASNLHISEGQLPPALAEKIKDIKSAEASLTKATDVLWSAVRKLSPLVKEIFQPILTANIAAANAEALPLCLGNITQAERFALGSVGVWSIQMLLSACDQLSVTGHPEHSGKLIALHLGRWIEQQTAKV